MINREHESQYTERSNIELNRAVGVVVDSVVERYGEGSRVILEGTPIYQDRPWDSDHQFGYNTAMPLLRERFGREFINVGQLALIDELNVAEDFRGSTSTRHIDYMRIKPGGIVFESQLVEEADRWVRSEKFRGNTKVIGGTLNLNHRERPLPLKTRSGNPSCEVLDALFQQQKTGCDSTVIIHPTSFRRQQEGMRKMLLALNGGELPFDIYTLFFRNGNLSDLIYSDRRGRDEKIRY